MTTGPLWGLVWDEDGNTHHELLRDDTDAPDDHAPWRKDGPTWRELAEWRRINDELREARDAQEGRW